MRNLKLSPLKVKNTVYALSRVIFNFNYYALEEMFDEKETIRVVVHKRNNKNYFSNSIGTKSLLSGMTSYLR